MINLALRNEALLILEGKGTILDVARQITQLLQQHKIPGAIIGGVAAVLHNHVRTTMDVDVWVPGDLALVGECLQKAGGSFDAKQHEFKLGQVPVHLVGTDQTGYAPTTMVEIEEIRTVSLADLI